MKAKKRANIDEMNELDLDADSLIAAMLSASRTMPVTILDSCGVGHLGSHLSLAGADPAECIEITENDPKKALRILDEKLESDRAVFFTFSYEFGEKLLGIHQPRGGKTTEPDISLMTFDAIATHDQTSRITKIIGRDRNHKLNDILSCAIEEKKSTDEKVRYVSTNFSKKEYCNAIDEIQELIRSGITYQTNLTRSITLNMPDDDLASEVFRRIRQNHPAPFAAFIKRRDSTVISASPERFFRIEGRSEISTSPIKGTRPRGKDLIEDNTFREDLRNSEKDRAENMMIVDLLRNDLGRICEYGSISVEKLCEIEEHPSLFHLVSTISGTLRKGLTFSDILRALFPCGSITGAPKISTMDVIRRLETVDRGLSMGAIGYRLPAGWLGSSEIIDTSVAIRTMTVRDRKAVFNVGGGIVIDSIANDEFAETATKATALLSSCGISSEISNN